MPLTENDLIIPALEEMYYSPNHQIQTSDLIERIAARFTLDNQDLTPLLNRNDEKFTQIVRNLKSHKTLRDAGLAVEIDGGFRLTPAGIRFLRDYGIV